MATYVIGDVQGCLEPLQRLLAQINYSPLHDKLWFCGDLIARGPQSLECLLFIRSLGDNAAIVLGNHDLHFIAGYYGFSKIKAADKLLALQQYTDLPSLVDWLCQQPLIHTSPDKQYIMVHAGLAPEWDIDTALHAASAVSDILKQQPKKLLSIMYGNQPEKWSDAVTEEQQLRFTVNACTRMRFCRADGSLELTEKGHPANMYHLQPWYEFWRNKTTSELFFGHWASLNGYSPIHNIHALDTGCVWGNTLTAYCIENQQRYSVEGQR